MVKVVPFPVSAFGDEAGASLQEQLRALKQNEIAGLDVRSVDGANVLDLDEKALEPIRIQCERSGYRVQAIGSPINKVKLGPDTYESQMAKLDKAAHAALRLHTNRIRIFTPEVPIGQEDQAWPELRKLMSDMIALATDRNLILVHENDARFYGAFPENAKRLFSELGGPNLKAAFDFANTVLIGFRPMEHWFPWLLPYLDTLHIKDAVEASGQVVPAGEGDGQLVETIRWLIDKGWHGPVTLEPHLQAAGPFGGFSGPDLFKVAADAMRNVVAEAGGETERL